MHPIDVAIIVFFMAYAVWSGFRSKVTASENLEEYFLAGRSLPGWKAGISMAATQFAADTPLLVTGLIATAGIFSLWQMWIYGLAFLLMGFVLAPSWRKLGVLTDAELTEVRYGRKPAAVLRGVKAIYFGTIFNCTVLAMVLFAAKEIAEPFLFWDQWLPQELFAWIQHGVEFVGVPFARDDVQLGDVWIRSTNNLISIVAIVGVTTLYSTTGGLRSVVNTDVMQFGLMMIGTFVYAVWVVDRAGGLNAIHDVIERLYHYQGPAGMNATQLLAFTPSNATHVSTVTIAVFALQWLVQINADGTGYLAQRSMACKSDDDAKQAAVVFTVAQILGRSLMWLPIGLGLLVIFPPEIGADLSQLRVDREATFIRGINELLPVGIRGLMLTSMLAALASTVDSHLNWGASYWTNDIYKRFIGPLLFRREPSDRSLVWVARAANLLILMLGLLIMTMLSSIQSAWQVSLLLGAGLGVTLVLRWLWWRMNAWGELSAIVASLITAPILLSWVPAEQEALRLLWMASVATSTSLIVSLITGTEKRERLIDFYRRAKPPGFWGPIAALENDPTGPKRLGRGLMAMGTSAFSIFSLLTGIGSWLVGSPAPRWFPFERGWIPLVLVLGIALIPVWWKLGFHRAEGMQTS